jgi:hypothetical protein
MKTFKLLFVLICAMICTMTAKADSKKTYTAERLMTTFPRIDGKLDDAAWKQGEWQGGFVQNEPYNNSEPSQQTEFKILYDDDHIYVAIRAFDSAPDSIVQRVTRRDNMDGDMVGIGIDSYFDQRTAFLFLVNAAGVKIDIINTNDGQSQDFTWDPIWHVKTSLDDQGWNAEMQIPLSELRFAKNKEHIWGLQAVRIIYRKQEMSFWQHIPKDAPGFVHQFGLLTGINGIQPKRLAEVSPYTVAQAETFKRQTGNPFADGNSSKFSGGIDGKIGITNDLTINLTINPDFGQVEADPSEVNLTAHETYFQEKRPFFIEGRNIYNFNLMSGDGDHSSENLFYSRRIGRVPQYSPSLSSDQYMNSPGNTSILGALKLSGKTNSGWSVGLLESVTGRERAEIDYMGERSYRTVEPLTNYFVGRVQKDFDKGNTIIGAMLTSTNRNLNDSSLYFLHRSAYTAGLDFRHSWKDKTYSIGLKTYFSHVAGEEEAILRTQTSSARYFQRPDATHLTLDPTRRSLSGHGGTFEFMKTGNGRVNYATFLNWKSPGLELNDIGFVRNTDEIFHVIWVGYRIWDPFSIFRRMNINLNVWNAFDFGGTHLYKGGNVNLGTQFKNYWSFGSGINYQGESISKSFLRGGPSMRLPDGVSNWLNLSSDSRKKVSISFNANNFWSLENHLRSQSYGLTISYKPMDVFSLSIRPSLSYYQPELQYVTRRAFNDDARYIQASLDQKTYSLTLRLNYSITPDFSIQYYGAPFFSTGKYTNFKYVTNPHADRFTDRFAMYAEDQISLNSAEKRYYIDENRDGNSDYSFAKPDFNAMFLNSNLVARWEYRPGSVVFLVWSQGRRQYDTNGDFMMHKDFSDIFEIHPHNVFLIKFSYRFGL